MQMDRMTAGHAWPAAPPPPTSRTTQAETFSVYTYVQNRTGEDMLPSAVTAHELPVARPGSSSARPHLTDYEQKQTLVCLAAEVSCPERVASSQQDAHALKDAHTLVYRHAHARACSSTIRSVFGRIRRFSSRAGPSQLGVHTLRMFDTASSTGFDADVHALNRSMLCGYAINMAPARALLLLIGFALRQVPLCT